MLLTFNVCVDLSLSIIIAVAKPRMNLSHRQTNSVLGAFASNFPIILSIKSDLMSNYLIYEQSVRKKTLYFNVIVKQVAIRYPSMNVSKLFEKLPYLITTKSHRFSFASFIWQFSLYGVKTEDNKS